MQRLAVCLSRCVGRFSRYQITRCKLHTSSVYSAMELRAVVSALEKIASIKHAENWDNVGLLVEPCQSGLINRVLLTNDLTEEVMDEIENSSDGKIGLIISYHPPIFRPFKRLTQSTPKERILLRAIQSGIGVYSPHTALDNMEQGINRWLLSGVGEGEITSLSVNKTPIRYSSVVDVCGLGGGEGSVRAVKEMVGKMEGVDISPTNDSSGSDVQLLCTDRCLAVLLPKLRDNFTSSRITVSSNTQVEVHPRGGKLLTLLKPASLSKLVDSIKHHLHLSHIRLARPYTPGETKNDPEIKSIAVCAGSGGIVLRGVTADLYLTGEMSHHDVLAATAQGTAVVLCDHSNTERGYLQTVYKKLVEEALGGQVEVVVSLTDRDPLEIV